MPVVLAKARCRWSLRSSALTALILASDLHSYRYISMKGRYIRFTTILVLDAMAFRFRFVVFDTRVRTCGISSSLPV